MGFSNNTFHIEGGSPLAEGAARFVFNGINAAAHGLPTELTTGIKVLHEVPDFAIDEFDAGITLSVISNFLVINGGSSSEVKKNIPDFLS